jgi:hypothetical protein
MIWLVDDALVVLRQEFEAGTGSFLLGLRPGLVWDRGAFTRLERAMRVVCERTQDDETLERWMAEGFYYVPRFVRDWTTHPNFPRPQPQQTTTIACSAWTIWRTGSSMAGTCTSSRTFGRISRTQATGAGWPWRGSGQRSWSRRRVGSGRCRRR